MHKNTTPARRVMARVLAEDLNQVNGGGYPPIDIGGGGDPTISEAATSESLPDPRPPVN
jgi:hypothetical protein